MNDKTSLIQPEQIEQVILLIRGQRVMLDRDLAVLYGVETKNLNKAVRRNLDRFPADFMFQLTLDKPEARAASTRSPTIIANPALAALRETPLPKLLSGELQISKIKT